MYVFLRDHSSIHAYISQVFPASGEEAGDEGKKQRRRRTFHCKFCGEKFKHSADLKLHQVNHQKEEYPYSCKKCKKTFARLCGISLHECKKDLQETEMTQTELRETEIAHQDSKETETAPLTNATSNETMETTANDTIQMESAYIFYRFLFS